MATGRHADPARRRVSQGVSDPGPGDHLPPWRSVLAVVAHPDDESFGLGAVLAGFADAGAAVAVLCFTHGESSTLHGIEGDLASLRAGELAGAARVLGVDPVRLLGYPDGALAEVDVDDLSAHVLDLAAEAFQRDGDLSDFAGRVSDSGEGRWTSIAAIDVGAPAPVLTTSLYERFTSRGEADFADRVLSAMRLGFGGHEEAKG